MPAAPLSGSAKIRSSSSFSAGFGFFRGFRLVLHGDAGDTALKIGGGRIAFTNHVAGGFLKRIQHFLQLETKNGHVVRGESQLDLVALVAVALGLEPDGNQRTVRQQIPLLVLQFDSQKYARVAAGFTLWFVHAQLSPGRKLWKEGNFQGNVCGVCMSLWSRRQRCCPILSSGICHAESERLLVPVGRLGRSLREPICAWQTATNGI